MLATMNLLDVLPTKVKERFLTLLVLSSQLMLAEKKLKQKVMSYLVFNGEVNAGLAKMVPNMISMEEDLLQSVKTNLVAIGLIWSIKRR